MFVRLTPFPLFLDVYTRQTRQSDNTYEDLEPEDSVMDMAKIVRQEFPGMFHGGDRGESSATSSSTTTLGGSIVAELLKSPQIQQVLSNLVSQNFQSSEFKTTVQVLMKELWTDLVEDPETLKQVIHLLQYTIQDETFSRTIDDRSGAAFGSILADSDGNNNRLVPQMKIAYH
jgi:hypothetical protein